MTATGVAAKYATWSAPGFPVRIESSNQVLEDIRLTAVEAYHRVPHGGVEIGGIFFGTHQKNVVRIKAYRPIECAYAKGPSFLLSESEEAALAETLKTCRSDAELARMEPVGWYRAHTRSEILLSDADLAFFNRFFPQPWQIGLIVRPASFGPTRAGFFFREPDGRIRTQSSYREFTLAVRVAARPARPEAAEDSPPVADAPSPPAVVEAPLAPETAPALEAVPVSAAPPEPARPESRPARESKPSAPAAIWAAPGKRRRQFAIGIGLLAVAILGYALLPSHRGLALTATDLRGQLRISWDRAARPIGRATGGSMEIDDHGVRTQVNLTAADLRSGSIFYAMQSGDVAVSLTVNVPGDPPVAESMHFVRPGNKVDSAKKDTPPPPAETPAHPETQARSEPPPPTMQVPPAQSPAPPLSVTERRVAPFKAPSLAASPKPGTDVQVIAPPTIDNLAAAPPPSGLPSVLGSSPHAAAAPAAPARPAAAASGRIIWTGKLARNGRLEVERNHASAGSVVGALPTAAAHVSAYPGDLTANGITIFTADARYAQPLTEKAGSDNGWNPTTYTWDPKRAAGLKVVEQPTQQNGYKLVLESEIPKLSVVMLEWRAAQ
jgi:proteasome lid subunit RPN8/RPN11